MRPKLYHSKEEKLEQMRKSQRRLKVRRKQEIDDLRRELEIMKEDLKRSRKREAIMDLNFQNALTILGEDVTSGQLNKLLNLERIPSGEFSSEDVVPVQIFVDQNDFGKYDILFIKGQFILAHVCDKIFGCMMKLIESDPKMFFNHRCFNQVKLHGLSLFSNFYSQVGQVSINGKIPKNWLAEENSFPNGTLGVNDVMKYIINHGDSSTINSEVLASLMCTHIFATNYGPAIIEKDLIQCLSLASTSKFDVLYILDILDETFCNCEIRSKFLTVLQEDKQVLK